MNLDQCCPWSGDLLKITSPRSGPWGMTDHSRYGIVSGHRFANDMVGQQTLVSGMGEQTGWAVLEGLACCIGRT